MWELSTESVYFITDKLPTTLNDLSKYFDGSMRFEVLVTLVALWFAIRQICHAIVPQSAGKIAVLIHALAMVYVSLNTLFTLDETSYWYPDMYDAMVRHNDALKAVATFGCYVSFTYFIHDSFYIHSAYIKHHIGACLVYLFCFYHTKTSLQHCSAGIGFFEYGAILVQLSRAFPNSLILRTFVCTGYAASRIGLAWYYGFVTYQAYRDWDTINVLAQLLYIPIYISLIFLLAINLRWTFLQWRSLVRAIKARYYKTESKEKSFFEFHQQILGNVPQPQVNAN